MDNQGQMYFSLPGEEIPEEDRYRFYAAQLKALDDGDESEAAEVRDKLKAELMKIYNNETCTQFFRACDEVQKLLMESKNEQGSP